MKKLTIITILLVAILSLAGCSQSFTPRNETTLDLTYVEQIEEQIEQEIEEKKTEQEQYNFEYGKVVFDTQYQKTQKGVQRQMLVRIIGDNQIEELNPDYIIVDGVVYTNPKNNPNIDLNELGIKPLFIDDFPSYDPDTQKIEVHYYDGGENIHRAWRVINLTKEEIEQREQIRDLMKGE